MFCYEKELSCCLMLTALFCSLDESMMTDSTADVPTIGGAVLVFLPGEQEIQRVKNYLEKRATENGKLWWVIPLHSKIPVDELNQVQFNSDSI